VTLSKGQIEEAMGRAALVTELNEIERRMAGLGQTAQKLGTQVQLAASEKKADAEAEYQGKLTECERMAEQLAVRREEILSLLWHPESDEEPRTWQEKLQALPREEALLTVEAVLRRRPEVSPPENVDAWELTSIRDWLVEKIGELPEDERDAWTRQ
jgi:hypothetical protein